MHDFRSTSAEREHGQEPASGPRAWGPGERARCVFHRQSFHFDTEVSHRQSFHFDTEDTGPAYTQSSSSHRSDVGRAPCGALQHERLAFLGGTG